MADRSLLPRALLLACSVLLVLAGTSQAAERGDVTALRKQALDLVNQTRREQGREPLTFSDTLNVIAQEHAEDMLARDYYAHVSPDGVDAHDRYLARGGDRHALVAENIASCSPCAEVPAAHHVGQMHRRWMESPHHRENILHQGVTRFGFGIVAGDDGPLYAVQTFAGPGTPRGGTPVAGSAEATAVAAAPLAPGEADAAFARALNARRQAQGRPPLELSGALSAAAARHLPAPAEEVTLGGGALEAGGDWATVSALAGSCSGCGAEATEGDIDDFLGMWLENAVYEERLLGPGATSVGFALRAYGDGRKVAVAVLGERR